MDDRYGRDVLSKPQRAKPRVPEVAAETDLVVEDAATGFCGAIVGLEKSYSGDLVRLEDRHGRSRVFVMHPAAFLIDGRPVTLVKPRGRGPQAPTRTASGSRVAPKTRARTARASRILVEGVHDATLIERVWGDDLRAEGVVVESLDGLDNLEQALAEFAPAPHRRAGVLVDHLVAGSKEAKLTADVGEHVLVCGHPYIDVWEAVKPASVGIDAWPRVPMGTDWKTGVCRQLGWGDPRDGWRRVLAGVRDYRDLETDLLRSVEELLDFVTAAAGDR
ncbi:MULTISPECIES: DUF3097 domain-containing protein [unclassified Gordonia (in: high G+C Gram-positive bacteria)]|uniref:DUF3097 domain-containing protein n=1 Tax=unclassified Gordonia (in: high G+C Gram-positive bacteria) TaxID=2657482 RepID=UPI001F116838|nr:DUF3097 domain-containing protein [Gordonia sp. ABSL49_1]MCH5642841.1 DUF3097 domain-containing protein [Gordonia sp. ABSL49_1]